MWNKSQIDQHKSASKKLSKILKSTATSINEKGTDLSEYQVSREIQDQFLKLGLISDRTPPIVAFRDNTSFVHYFPTEKSKKLEKESLILVDLWAREKVYGAPFSDITWMFYFGKRIPPVIQETFFHVSTARDKAVKHLRTKLKIGQEATGQEVDKKVRNYFLEKNLDDKFLHSTGHSLGHNKSPHGRYGHLKHTNESVLIQNLGYTIEPGLYFENQFGVRSEIDFVIIDNTLTVTTPIQKEITLI